MEHEVKLRIECVMSSGAPISMDGELIKIPKISEYIVSKSGNVWMVKRIKHSADMYGHHVKLICDGGY